MKSSDLTLYVVNDDHEMNAITGKLGDICVCTKSPFDCVIWAKAVEFGEDMWAYEATETPDEIYMALLNTSIPKTDNMSVLTGECPDTFKRFGCGEFKQTLTGAVHNLVCYMMQEDSPYRAALSTAADSPLLMSLSIRIITCTTVSDAPSYYIRKYQPQTSQIGNFDRREDYIASLRSNNVIPGRPL